MLGPFGRNRILLGLSYALAGILPVLLTAALLQKPAVRDVVSRIIAEEDSLNDQRNRPPVFSAVARPSAHGPRWRQELEQECEDR